MDRRTFLATTGSTLVGLAGCTSAPTASRQLDASEATPTSSWPQFGADPRNTGHGANVAGPGPSGAQLAWRYDAGTPTMNTSPVVGEGIVYVPGSGDPGLIHAIDIKTGDQIWEFDPAGYATSALALADETLYVGTWGKHFYAIDAATGDPRWSEEIGHRFGSSSPVVGDGTVYVGTRGDGPLVVSGTEEEKFEACAFLALDTDSGDVQWEYRDFGERDNIESSPAVADGRVYFGGEHALYALDAATGEEVWTRAIPTHPQSSPAVVDGVVYYGATAGGESETPAKVWALDATTGETLWTAGIDDESLRTSPAVADGTVYVAASSRRVCLDAGGSDERCSGVTRGQLYALDAASGERRWTADVKTDTRSSPAVADGVIYVGCRDGISAVTTDGKTAWRITFENDREDPPYVKSSPAVADGYVFIGASDGRLRAINASEPSDRDEIMIDIRNSTSQKLTVHVLLSQADQTILEEELSIDSDGDLNVDAGIEERGQYALTVTVDDRPEDTFLFSVDNYDLRHGSNLIVSIDDKSIDIVMEE